MGAIAVPALAGCFADPVAKSALDPAWQGKGSVSSLPGDPTRNLKDPNACQQAAQDAMALSAYLTDSAPSDHPATITAITLDPLNMGTGNLSTIPPSELPITDEAWVAIECYALATWSGGMCSQLVVSASQTSPSNSVVAYWPTSMGVAECSGASPGIYPSPSSWGP